MTGEQPARSTPAHSTPAGRRPPRRSTAVLTGVLHLVALAPYAASGLLAPPWGVAAMLAVWALLGLAAAAVHRRWGAVSALLPLVAVLVWAALVTLGEVLLGWSA